MAEFRNNPGEVAGRRNRDIWEGTGLSFLPLGRWGALFVPGQTSNPLKFFWNSPIKELGTWFNKYRREKNLYPQGWGESSEIVSVQVSLKWNFQMLVDIISKLISIWCPGSNIESQWSKETKQKMVVMCPPSLFINSRANAQQWQNQQMKVCQNVSPSNTCLKLTRTTV